MRLELFTRSSVGYLDTALARLGVESARDSEEASVTQEATRRYRRAVQGLGVPAALLAPGRIIDANERFAKLLNATSREVVGHALDRFLSPQVAAFTHDIIRRGRRCDTILRTLDGSPVAVQIESRIVGNSPFDLFYIIISAQPIGSGRLRRAIASLRPKFWQNHRVFELSELARNPAHLLRSRRLFPAPLMGVQVELQSGCNRDCWFCPRHTDRTGIRKDENGKDVSERMPTEQVYSILDQLADLRCQGELSFHRLSEPLLDDRYVEIARHAVSRGFRIGEDTNGDLLKNRPELCRELDGLLDSLRIGLYDYVTEAQRADEVAFWRARFHTTRLKFNLPLEQLIPRPRSKIPEGARDLLLADYLDHPCHRPYQSFHIRYDGKVALCCEDDLCAFDLGNAFETPVRDLLFSRGRIALARTLARPGGRRTQELCRSCWTNTIKVDWLSTA